MPEFLDYNRTIVGYHGTSRARAEQIVRNQSFNSSRNNHDWLGHGMYFWEHAPKQAKWWAERRFKGDAAVVASMIRLGNCLDMLDPDNCRLLSDFHDVLVRDGVALPENHNTRKYRDCAVFESYYAAVQSRSEPSIDSARGVYVPTPGASGAEDSGYRLWKRSWLTFDAHIQICVRNPKCILGTWPVVRV
jgi:hypothetical protein